MTLIAPDNSTTGTVSYSAIPHVGSTVGATPSQVNINVPANCICFALEIYNAAMHWNVDPYYLAAIAAQERCAAASLCTVISGAPPISTNALCGTNVSFGEDGTGRGIFQFDLGFFPGFAFGGALDPWSSADYAAEIIHYYETLAGSEQGAGDYYHGFNQPSVFGPDGVKRDYALSVEAFKTAIKSKYSFDCVTKVVAIDNALGLNPRLAQSYIRSGNICS